MGRRQDAEPVPCSVSIVALLAASTGMTFAVTPAAAPNCLPLPLADRLMELGQRAAFFWR
ncbi:MAG: hypothetical protein CBB71_15145 [Rhodopirellula sp. TMED11]|nr:MAG: hypothetical protein CBB71_15145 [Rhodopirellula sp. TMED11]